MQQQDITDYQQSLFPYAYNILGVVEDAKDVVQEAITRHLASPPQAEITSLKNYLIKSVINLAINTKNRLEKTLRQQDVWLPEPVATDDAADRNLHLREVLSYSLMMLMEKLSATERAVFILRETFDYSHEEIGEVLNVSEEYSRKLLSRAKTKLFKPAAPPKQSEEEHKREIVNNFISAIRQRDMEQLERMLTADIRYYADSGGKVPMITAFREGFDAVSALEIIIFEKFLKKARIEYITINHQPAMLAFREDRLMVCQVMDIHPVTGMVTGLHAILDPDKLKPLTAIYGK